MSMRSTAILLLVLAVVAGAFFALRSCDREEEIPLDELFLLLDQVEEGTQQEEVIQRLGRRGRAEPEEMIPLFIERLRKERADPESSVIEFTVPYSKTTLDESARKQELREIGLAMTRRQNVYGFAGVTVRVVGLTTDGDGVIQLEVPRPFDEAEEAALLQQRLRLMSAPGSSELLVVAEPPAEGLKPPSLWDGDRASFDAFVEEERARLSKAEAAEESLVPDKRGYRLVPLRPQAPGKPPRLIVCVEPASPAEQFRGDSFELIDALDPRTNRLLFQMTPSPDRLKDLEAWSTKHLHRDVAIVVNGRAEVVARVRQPITGRMDIDVGPLSEVNRRWVGSVRRAIAAPYPREIEGRILPNDPRELSTKMARVLAACGPAADPYLEALQQEGGSLARRARWAREELAKAEAIK